MKPPVLPRLTSRMALLALAAIAAATLLAATPTPPAPAPTPVATKPWTPPTFTDRQKERDAMVKLIKDLLRHDRRTHPRRPRRRPPP